MTNRPDDLFVTGCYRSGTTLTEKLLHNHSHIILASQPFPLLFFHAKSRFYEQKQMDRRYPLEHLFLEDGYTADEFYAFLDAYRFSAEEIGNLFDELAAYDLGLWTPDILQFRDEILPGTFLDIYLQLNDAIAKLFPKPAPRYAGGKEVLCEEYAPYFVRNGIRVILVVRDPRSMIASLNFRNRDNLTGDNRPVLYSLRAWRKSVAVALAYEQKPYFTWIRYEDLVMDPLQTLNVLAERLAIEPFDVEVFRQGILDQSGAVWQGNSSFDDRAGISTESVNSYETKLPAAVVDYIEACCLPEMVALGYLPLENARFESAAIRIYRDPFGSIHTKFPQDYSSSSSRVNDEIDRYSKLIQTSPLTDGTEIQKWFLYDTAYRKLRAALRTELCGSDE